MVLDDQSEVEGTSYLTITESVETPIKTTIRLQLQGSSILYILLRIVFVVCYF